MGLPWKWFVLFGAFLSRVVTTGTVVCLGVFYNEFKSSFPTWSNAQIGAVFSTATGLLEGSGIVASMLMKKVESRYLVVIGGVVAAIGVALASRATDFVQMIVCLSVLNGLGQGIARCLLPVAVAHSFHDHDRHAAVALQNVGDGIGGLIFPLFYKYLIDQWSWRGALLITAGIVLQLLISGAVVEKHRQSISVISGDQRLRSETFTQRCLSMTPNIQMLYLNIFAHSLGYYIFMAFVYTELTAQHIDESLASAMFACVGGVSILARLSVSLLGNGRVPRWLTYAVMHMVRGLIVLSFNAVPHLRSHDHRVISYFLLCSAFGVTDGLTGSLIAVVCLDLFGLRRMADVYGGLLFFMGAGALLGSPIAGAMMDAFSGSTYMPLLFSGISFIISGIVLLPLFCTKKHYQLAAHKNHEVELREMASDS